MTQCRMAASCTCISPTTYRLLAAQQEPYKTGDQQENKKDVERQDLRCLNEWHENVL